MVTSLQALFAILVSGHLMNNKDMLEAHNKINESTGKISNFKNNQNKKNFIIFQHAFEKKKQTNEISFFSPDGRRTQTTAKQTTSNQTGTSNKTGTSNQTTSQPSKKFWSFGKVGNSWESNSFLLIVNSIMFYLFIFFSTVVWIIFIWIENRRLCGQQVPIVEIQGVSSSRWQVHNFLHHRRIHIEKQKGQPTSAFFFLFLSSFRAHPLF